MKKILLGTTALLLMNINISQAQMFKITHQCSTLITICDALKDKLQDELNKKAPDAPVDKYAAGMAKANKISAKGGSTDYANLFDVAMVGGSINAGVQAKLDGKTDNIANTASGVALSPGVLIGVNLDLLPISKIGSLEMKDLDLFISFISWNKDKLIDDKTLKMDAEINHLGFEARYRWIKAEDIFPAYMLQWTGVQLHTGYQYTSNKLTAKYKLDAKDIDPIVVPGGTANFNGGNAGAKIEHTSHTIPLELSTGLRFLYAFTLYGGVGTDFTLSSKSDADLNANATIVGTVPGEPTPTFDAEGNQKGDGKADFFNTRAFLGLQVNLPFTSIFVQGHKYLGDDTYALNAGLKFYY